jgi:hypothetical protein
MVMIQMIDVLLYFLKELKLNQASSHLAIFFSNLCVRLPAKKAFAAIPMLPNAVCTLILRDSSLDSLKSILFTAC